MNKTQHTPTPDLLDVDTLHRILNGGATEQEVRAIVKACNAHDANVARIAELEAALETHLALTRQNIVNGEAVGALETYAAEKVRTALAKVNK